MLFIKNFLQITFFLFLSFTLNIIEWTPSLMLENIINSIIIILYIIAVFFVYKTIRTFYYKHKKKAFWMSILYTTFLLTYIGLFAIFMIGVSYSKSNYIQDYEFNNKTFYVYKNVDASYEVSIKNENLPTRSLPITSFSNREVRLIMEKDYIFATGEDVYEKIYDLKDNIVIKSLEIKKEDNE